RSDPLKTLNTRVCHPASPYFAVAGLETFELGPTLLRGPEETTSLEALRHGPVHLAVPLTGPRCFKNLGLDENGEEGLGFLITPVHTCHKRRVSVFSE
uniref:Uncharacterized protein n=1 Tax=Ornithorhynchus anatinus TaxID=9258 RepID=A0A6I8NRD7_ORNAN